MRVCIHRGSTQIGGNCVEIKSMGQRLVIDLGLPLDVSGDPKQYIPPINGLDGSDPTLLGILVSHPHLDHYGLLGHVSDEIPVGMGPAARRILKASAPFMRSDWDGITHGWNYCSKKTIKIGPFDITPIMVDHSAYDAYALLIRSNGKSVFYSGDLRSHGRKASLFKQLMANPPKGIDVLLLEGTSIGQQNQKSRLPSEQEVELEFLRAFEEIEGLALVHVSAQNIDRIVSIFKASKRSGRRMVIDLYTAAILEATENLKLPQSYWSDISLYIPQVQRVQILKNEWFDLLKRHSVNRIFIENIKESSQKLTMLFRPLHMRDLENADCLNDAGYIYSLWEGYWESDSYDRVKLWLQQNGIPKISIHTSGHAGLIDLAKLVSAIKPGKVVPIHSFSPEQYKKNFTNTQVHVDGEWWEV